jgi:hypothetical protein
LDTGKIRELAGAEGWVALFAIPEPPFVEQRPVIKFVHVIRDSQDYVEGMVSAEGEPTGTYVSMLEDENRKFIKYLSLYAYSQPVIDILNSQAYASAVKDGQLEGYQMYLGQQEALVAQAEEDAPRHPAADEPIEYVEDQEPPEEGTDLEAILKEVEAQNT